MPYPLWLPGMRITAARLNAGHWEMVEQQADQILTSTTTYTDSEITFTPDTDAVYLYFLWISYSADENADFQWRWSAAQATFASFTQARHPDATGTFNAPAEVIFRRPGNTTDRLAGGGGSSPPSSFFSAYDQGTFATTSIEDTVTMQFTQRVSNPGQTILRGGNQTRLVYKRIA